MEAKGGEDENGDRNGGGEIIVEKMKNNKLLKIYGIYVTIAKDGFKLFSGRICQTIRVQKS